MDALVDSALSMLTGDPFYQAYEIVNSFAQPIYDAVYMPLKITEAITPFVADVLEGAIRGDMSQVDYQELLRRLSHVGDQKDILDILSQMYQDMLRFGNPNKWTDPNATAGGASSTTPAQTGNQYGIPLTQLSYNSQSPITNTTTSTQPSGTATMSSSATPSSTTTTSTTNGTTSSTPAPPKTCVGGSPYECTDENIKSWQHTEEDLDKQIKAILCQIANLQQQKEAAAMSAANCIVKLEEQLAEKAANNSNSYTGYLQANQCGCTQPVKKSCGCDKPKRKPQCKKRKVQSCQRPLYLEDPRYIYEESPCGGYDISPSSYFY